MIANLIIGLWTSAIADLVLPIKKMECIYFFGIKLVALANRKFIGDGAIWGDRLVTQPRNRLNALSGNAITVMLRLSI